MLSSFVFTVVIDTVTEPILKHISNEMLTINLVFRIETIEGFTSKLIKLKETFESNGVKVKILETKVIVSRHITKNWLSKYGLPMLVLKLESKG